MWTKKFLFYFLFQKRILWYGLLLPYVMILMKSSCFFFPFFKNFQMLFFLSSHTDSWKALPFILYFPFFLWGLQNGMFMWHMQNLPSPWWCEEPCWGSPRGTVIHTTQEIPLDQSINASRPARIAPLVSHHSCVCSRVCVFVCLWERKPGVRSYFLQIIKAQIQSPRPSLMLFDCLEKPQCASPRVWHFAQVCVHVIVCVAVL